MVISVATTSPTKPITVKLGLWSPTYQGDNNIDPIGAQTLAAFLMAVDEINANNYLPNVRINVAITFKEDAYGGIIGAQELLSANFSIDSSGQHVPTHTFVGNNPIGVDFVVATGDDDETEHAGLVFQNFKVVQLHTAAMDTKFALGRSYPSNTYKVQDVPVNSYQGMVWQVSGSFGISSWQASARRFFLFVLFCVLWQRLICAPSRCDFVMYDDLTLIWTGNVLQLFRSEKVCRVRGLRDEQH